MQLLRYHHPDAIVDPNIDKLYKLGFNHICFAVDDLDAEVAKLKAAGVKLRNEVMQFHSRKLVFLWAGRYHRRTGPVALKRSPVRIVGLDRVAI